MKESELKTSTKQRVLIAIIAAIMLGASLAIYVSVIVSQSAANSSTTSAVDQELIADLQAQYTAKNAEYQALGDDLSEQYFDDFNSYRSEVKAFNATSANEGLSVQDLKIGDGDVITATSENYGAYYVGWCANETVFDSSFDDFSSPTKLSAPLVVEQEYLIEGWYQGVDGMRLGGIRVVTIPGELAYGEDYNPCDSASEERNVPLKFLIMAIPVSEEYINTTDEISNLYMSLVYAQYGSGTSE